MSEIITGGNAVLLALSIWYVWLLIRSHRNRD